MKSKTHSLHTYIFRQYGSIKFLKSLCNLISPLLAEAADAVGGVTVTPDAVVEVLDDEL